MQQAIAVGLIKLPRNFQRELTPDITETYAEELCDLDPEFLALAFRACLRICFYFPKIAEIRREYYALVEQERLEERAKIHIKPEVLGRYWNRGRVRCD